MPTVFEDNVVEFRGVSKRFRIQEGSTLQEFVPALFKGKGFKPPFDFREQDPQIQSRMGRSGALNRRSGR